MNITTSNELKQYELGQLLRQLRLIVAFMPIITLAGIFKDLSKEDIEKLNKDKQFQKEIKEYLILCAEADKMLEPFDIITFGKPMGLFTMTSINKSKKDIIEQRI